MTRLGFAYNPTQEPAQELRDRALGWCAVRGVDAWAAPAGDAWLEPERVASSDAVVVLGGDGTFLRAARAVAETDVPILGINTGKVGFLSKAEPDRLEAVLGHVVAGEYDIEERMALEAQVWTRDGREAPTTHIALNEAAIVRGGRARVVRLEVLVDELLLATYVCDGLVVATPTGSTGYSFSAGGPIVDPTSRNLVVTPIAAYLTPLRSSVVSPRHIVRVRVEEAFDCLVSIDGREDIPLEVGDAVEVSARDAPIRFDPATRRPAVLGPARERARAAAEVTGQGDQGATTAGRAGLDRAIAAYLDHLRVERGLARATLTAYGTDLRRFRDGAPGIAEWAASADPALGYLASLTRPPRVLRPTSVRRKAAAIRAFYRFCDGDGSSTWTCRRSSTCRVSRGTCRTRSTARRLGRPAARRAPDSTR